MDTKSVLAIVAALACLSAVPAATAVHQTGSGSIDGSTSIACGTSTMLFGGAVPHNGFMVESNYAHLFINDNGPATYDPTTGIGTGFFVDPRFTTPPDYKPMGPVSVYAYSCASTQAGPLPAYVAARAW